MEKDGKSAFNMAEKLRCTAKRQNYILQPEASMKASQANRANSIPWSLVPELMVALVSVSIFPGCRLWLSQGRNSISGHVQHCYHLGVDWTIPKLLLNNWCMVRFPQEKSSRFRPEGKRTKIKHPFPAESWEHNGTTAKFLNMLVTATS